MAPDPKPTSTPKHSIVAVDAWVESPKMNFEYDMTKYRHTSPEELPGRIKDATIVISSATPITRSAIENAHRLQLVSVNSTGTDQVDKAAMRELGITLCHVPAQNSDSVCEHAFALYYAVRRHILPMHQAVVDAETWVAERNVFMRLGEPPRTNAEETLVVVGYGALGRKVETMGSALGMEVLIAERKGAEVIRNGRTAFDDALKQGTLFIIVAPLDESTRNMIAAAELQMMDHTAVVVNVGRGGVVNEQDLASALRERRIGGAGSDVFEHEPPILANCPLLDPSVPNFVASPHVAWYSSKTIKGTQATAQANIEGFVSGRPRNVVVAGTRVSGG